ncbi:unnamed protein product, partial [Callosobruchus maculatus]
KLHAFLYCTDHPLQSYSYISIKYDYDADDNKDLSKNIIENLRNKLAHQQATTEEIVQEKETLLEEIKDLKREIFNKKETVCKLQKVLDNLSINKLLMLVQTQTENDRTQEVNSTLQHDIAKMEKKSAESRYQQTRASGTCPETTNQSVQYPMEDSGSTSGVQSVVQQESRQPEVQSKSSKDISPALFQLKEKESKYGNDMEYVKW